MEGVSLISAFQGKEEGTIEVHMEMKGVQGPKKASLEIHTSDKKLPMVNLQWEAAGASMFVLAPTFVTKAL